MTRYTDDEIMAAAAPIKRHLEYTAGPSLELDQLACVLAEEVLRAHAEYQKPENHLLARQLGVKPDKVSQHFDGDRWLVRVEGGQQWCTCTVESPIRCDYCLLSGKGDRSLPPPEDQFVQSAEFARGGIISRNCSLTPPGDAYQIGRRVHQAIADATRVPEDLLKTDLEERWKKYRVRLPDGTICGVDDLDDDTHYHGSIGMDRMIRVSKACCPHTGDNRSDCICPACVAKRCSTPFLNGQPKPAVVTNDPNGRSQDRPVAKDHGVVVHDPNGGRG